MTSEMIKVTYRGIDHWITREQFEDLKAGWITWADMFE